MSESTYQGWKNPYSEMKCEEAVRLKENEEENHRLKQIVADQALDIQRRKHLSEGNW